MPVLVNSSNGLAENIPQEAADKGLQEGSHEIPLYDAEGNFGSAPVADAQDLLRQGYRQPDPKELAALLQKAKTSSIGQKALTAAEGAASGATFGLSRYAESSVFNNQQEQKERAESNPEYRVGGELAGIGASLLVPGYGEANAAERGGVEAAQVAAELLNPVKTVSKIGQAASEAASPAAEKAASLLINPETSPALHGVASKALSGAVGGATEGAAYGVGQTIDESALGDPGTVGEKLMANVGHAALFGGALAGVIEGALAPLAKDSALTEMGRMRSEARAVEGETAARTPGILGAIEDSPTLSAEQKKSVLEQFSKVKENAPELRAIGKKYGIDITEDLLTDSPNVQKALSSVEQSNSLIGYAQKTRLVNAWNKIKDVVSEQLGSDANTANMSVDELGRLAKSGMSEAVKAESDPIASIYEDQIKPYFGAIPVKPKALQSIARNIEHLESLTDEGGTVIAPSSKQATFARQVAKDLENVSTLDGLKKFKTAYRTIDPELRYVAGQINEKLSNLETRAIREFADGMKTPAAKEKIEELLSLRKEADAKYSALRDKLSEIGEATGKRRVYGPKDFTDWLDDVDSTKFGARIAKGSPEFLTFMKENFPKQFDQVAGYTKSKILQKAMKQGETGMELNPKAAVKAIEELPKETRSLVFKPDELQKISDMKQLLDARGTPWGPSGTPGAMQHVLGWLNPKFALAIHAKDFAITKLAKYLVGADDSAAYAKASVLGSLQGMADKVTKQVAKGSKALFGAAPDLGVASVALLPNRPDRKSDSAQDLELIKKLQSDPNQMMTALYRATGAAAAFAPNVATSLNAAATRAVGYLSSQIPAENQKYAIGSDSKPSQAELAKFHRALDVVENPMHVLGHMKDGTLSLDHVLALKNVYPQIYSEMRSELVQNLANHLHSGESVPYSLRMSLSMFLGQPLDSSLSQASIVAAQQSAPQTAPQSQAPTQSAMGKMAKLPAMYQTPNQARLSDRIGG